MLDLQKSFKEFTVVFCGVLTQFTFSLKLSSFPVGSLAKIKKPVLVHYIN